MTDDLPFDEQVRLLRRWIDGPRIAPFQRTVPVDPKDHDVLIEGVITKALRYRALLAQAADQIAAGWTECRLEGEIRAVLAGGQEGGDSDGHHA